MSEKLKALTHFIIHECRDNPRKLGAIRLNKSLLKADILSYRISGQSISGDSYVKRKNGPVPANILATLRDLKNENAIVVNEPSAKYEPRVFISMRDPSEAYLSEVERKMAIAALEEVCGMTAYEASEETHDVVWDAAQDGEEIPLHAFLAGKTGSLSPEIVSWAKESLAS